VVGNKQFRILVPVPANNGEFMNGELDICACALQPSCVNCTEESQTCWSGCDRFAPASVASGVMEPRDSESLSLQPNLLWKGSMDEEDDLCKSGDHKGGP